MVFFKTGMESGSRYTIAETCWMESFLSSKTRIFSFMVCAKVCLQTIMLRRIKTVLNFNGVKIWLLKKSAAKSI